MSYACKIYMVPGPDGGDKMVVESGGLIEIVAVGGLTVNGESIGSAVIADVTATAAELNKLSGSGAAVASGTQAAAIADIAVDANGTAIATAVNAIIAALEAFGITATS